MALHFVVVLIFHGEIYQIRMENVSFYNDESVVFMAN